MDKNRIYLSTSHMSGNEFSLIEKNQPFLFGKNILEFEKKISNYIGEDLNVTCLVSGTSAIHLALILSEVGLNDDVICQSMTFSASANPIKYQGANPIFIDSEKDTWNMCPKTLEKAIKTGISKGKKPKAIIVVHLYGMPAKMDEILAVAKKYKITLIEDAAEALGSTYKVQKCGTFGDFGIFSFNGNKIISTFGGGALVCKTKESKQKAIFLATQARDNTPHYQHSEIGYNYIMSNALAAIGRVQMEILDKHVGLRRANNKFYQELFKDIEGITVFTELTSDYFSNHWLSAIIVDEAVTGFSREDLRLKLQEDNIESRPLWKPMHMQPVFKDCKYFGSSVSENLFKDGLCLPSGSNLKDADRDRIRTSIYKMI